MTLSDLDNYVKVNKHLPYIPSAEQFKKEGYSLSNMDEMILRNIEELTLHVIELNKRISALENENQQLRK